MSNWVESIFGKRILKTAIAVFLTTTICHLLGLPAVFAVIAAIVTIEPTVRSSIQKGKIRLPAAALGAAIAMFFDYIFGQTAITYALSAFFTILICHRLRWDDAILVATLTAMAMIPMTSDNFFLAFLSRIGTTTIGIVVSILVNFIVWPPNFMKEIPYNLNLLFQETKKLIETSLDFHLFNLQSLAILKIRFEHLRKGMNRIYTTINYQKEEYLFRKKDGNSLHYLNSIQDQYEVLEKISFHIGNILSLPSTSKLTAEEQNALKTSWEKIEYLNREHNRPLDDEDLKREILQPLHSLMQFDKEETHFSKSSSLAYELVFIFQLIIEYMENEQLITEQKQENTKYRKETI